MTRRILTTWFGRSVGILALATLGVSYVGHAEKRSNALTRVDSQFRSTSAVTPAQTAAITINPGGPTTTTDGDGLYSKVLSAGRDLVTASASSYPDLTKL